MTTADSPIPTHYLRFLAEFLAGRGVDVERLLAQSGLGLDDVLRPDFVVTYPLFRHLVVDALALTREPALGLLIGERLTVSTHGVVGFAALHAGTVRQTLTLLERYLTLRTTLLSVRHEVQGHEVRIHFAEAQPLGEIRRPVLEAVMLAFRNVLDHVTMGNCRFEQVHFAFAQPDYAALAEGLFACPVRYSQPWTGLVLPAAQLDVPLKMADPLAFEEAAAICQRALDALTAHASWSGRVRRLLLERQNGFPTLPLAARLFHLTPRTLHRRLVAEGTSYGQLLDEVRHLLAVEHVRSGRLGLAEVAWMLGYTDLANFRRAWKRWEGVAPSVWRARQTATHLSTLSALPASPRALKALPASPRALKALPANPSAP